MCVYILFYNLLEKARGSQWWPIINQPAITYACVTHSCNREMGHVRGVCSHALARLVDYIVIGGLRNQKVRSLLDVPSMIPA